MKMGKIIGFFIVFSLILPSCKANKTDVKVEFDQEAFITHRQKWQQANVNNYKYQLIAYDNKENKEYSAIITVENGIYKENSHASDDFNINYFLNFSTIDKIYNWLELTYNENDIFRFTKFGIYITNIYAEYDEINHIPIIINYKIKAPFFIDVDGINYFKINNFEKKDE
jgi:hypothetical protein